MSARHRCCGLVNQRAARPQFKLSDMTRRRWRAGGGHFTATGPWALNVSMEIRSKNEVVLLEPNSRHGKRPDRPEAILTIQNDAASDETFLALTLAGTAPADWMP